MTKKYNAVETAAIARARDQVHALNINVLHVYHESRKEMVRVRIHRLDVFKMNVVLEKAGYRKAPKGSRRVDEWVTSTGNSVSLCYPNQHPSCMELIFRPRYLVAIHQATDYELQMCSSHCNSLGEPTPYFDILKPRLEETMRQGLLEYFVDSKYNFVDATFINMIHPVEY